MRIGHKDELLASGSNFWRLSVLRICTCFCLELRSTHSQQKPSMGLLSSDKRQGLFIVLVYYTLTYKIKEIIIHLKHFLRSLF